MIKKASQKEIEELLGAELESMAQPGKSAAGKSKNEVVNPDIAKSNVVKSDISKSVPPPSESTQLPLPPIATSKARYEGDYIEPNKIPLKADGFQCLNFESPAELVAFFDPDINAGETTLHRWQVEESFRLASAKPSSKHPFKYVLCAANGSGKDAFVLAPFAVWFALCKIQSVSIITSASCQQLNAQTENYIRRLCERVNIFYGTEYFRIRQRFIYCTLSGSEIRLFATDEAGKAEGYHPLWSRGEMAIIVNEAKSVSPEIFGALRRCTGYSYFILVSTPGEPSGEFHTAFEKWPNKRLINYFDCPHLSEDDYKYDLEELGENNPLFRSKWLALFTSLGAHVVIPKEMVEKWLDMKVEHIFKSWPLRIGIDLAAGGDECVISVWQGNKRIQKFAWRERDTTKSADIIDIHLSSLGIPKSHNFIRADDGGIGRGIIDQLRRMGWNIQRVLNQSPPKRKGGEYKNRGAEMWFRFKRFIEVGVLVPFEKHDKAIKQFYSRHYKQSEGSGGFVLRSKASEKAEGHPSPDHADADVLALSDLSIEDFLNDRGAEEEKKKDVRIPLGLDPAKTYEDLVFSGQDKMRKRGFGERLRGSLSAWINKRDETMTIEE